MTIVVIGSSGGGTATLGHTNAQDLLSTIHAEFAKLKVPKRNEKQNDNGSFGIKFALFVSASVSMDSINPKKDIATLWTVGLGDSDNSNIDTVSNSFQVTKYCSGLLEEVNQIAKELGEKYVSSAILAKDSSIKGVVCISCDPNDVNYSILSAAAKAGLPMTGSGGTSLSAAVTIHKGLSLVGNSGGSVATTTYTRAVSYCSAISKHWELDYSYSSCTNIGSSTSMSTTAEKPHIGSILDACLPSFLAVCVTCQVITRINLLGDLFKGTEFVSKLQYQALPTVCSVVAATSLSPEHGSTAVMASVIASMSCYGSILAGLLAGWIVSSLVGRTLFMCIKSGVPATMTNIIVAGFLGSMVAFTLSITKTVHFLSICANVIRMIVRNSPKVGNWDGSGFGFVFGCLFCYGSKVGWYHSIFLPVILIEMEHGEASMWGSVDECTLVLVSAGICAAHIVTSRGGACQSSERQSESENALFKRGLKTNLFCGDFIEVAYPSMEKSKIVNLTAYVASGISTEILYRGTSGDVMSSAYFPVPISIFLAHDRYRIILAMFSAFSVSFLGVLLSYVFMSDKKMQHEQVEKCDKKND